jgi:hypothetical protein
LENVIHTRVVEQSDIWLIPKVSEKTSLKIEGLREAGHLIRSDFTTYSERGRVEFYPCVGNTIPDLMHSKWLEME